MLINYKSSAHYHVPIKPIHHILILLNICRDLERGELVVEYAGELIGPKEAKRRELQYSADQNAGCYMYYFIHRATQYW